MPSGLTSDYASTGQLVMSQMQMDLPSTPEVKPANAPKSLTADRLQALLQMQKTDPFCKRISKCLPNGKAPQHETDLFTHVKGLLYKHITDSCKKFLA